MSRDSQKATVPLDQGQPVDQGRIYSNNTATDASQLHQLMWECNLVNIEAAEILGVSERTIYRWLSGKSKIPATAISTLEARLKTLHNPHQK